MYNYHKLDCSKNKSMYMYSRYFGKKFINEFLSSRNFFLKKKKINYESKLTRSPKINLSLLLSFEKNKIIFIKKKKLSINDYIELSYRSGNQIKKNISLLYINALLKLNDHIIFLSKKTEKNLNSKIDDIFIIEKNILNKLCKILKLNEKIKF